METKLDQLSDDELKEYYLLFKNSSKRAEDVKMNNFDSKFAYHIVRLISEAEQVLVDHDINLQRDNEVYKAIRRGEWEEEKIRDYISGKEKYLENLYENSTMVDFPDENEIKNLLLQCLEIHYGNLSNCIIDENATVNALKNIVAEVDKYRNLVS